MKADDQRGSPGQSIGMAPNCRRVEVVFAVLGDCAILATGVTTILVERSVAWLLLFWGLAGLVLAHSFRGVSEWRLMALLCFVTLLAGLAFLVLPGRGGALLIAVMAVVFLLDGALSIPLRLRPSGEVPGCVRVIVSGICTFLLGLLILVQWPTTPTWVLGFLIGLIYLTTGLSMFLLSQASGRRAQ